MCVLLLFVLMLSHYNSLDSSSARWAYSCNGSAAQTQVHIPNYNVVLPLYVEPRCDMTSVTQTHMISMADQLLAVVVLCLLYTRCLRCHFMVC
jgi:hypothetical protein